MFYSQFGEDRFILEHRLCPDTGVFVDIGAGDPVSLCNTYAFEQLGWAGLAIDPHPNSRQSWSSKRSAPLEPSAIKSYDGTTIFHLARDPSLSTTLDPTGLSVDIKVPCFRLETLLTKHRIGLIDLLSIDVEGCELEVYDSMVWELHRPRILIIEYNTLGRPCNDALIQKYFERLPYHLIHTTPCNFLFLLDEP